MASPALQSLGTPEASAAADGCANHGPGSRSQTANVRVAAQTPPHLLLGEGWQARRKTHKDTNTCVPQLTVAEDVRHDDNSKALVNPCQGNLHCALDSETGGVGIHW